MAIIRVMIKTRYNRVFKSFQWTLFELTRVRGFLATTFTNFSLVKALDQGRDTHPDC